MSGRTKFFGTLVFSGIFLCIAGWAIVFGLAERFVTITPVGPKPLKEGSPEISLRFLDLPLAYLSDVKIVVDDEDVSNSVARTNTSLSYKPEHPFFDGRHTVQTDLTYHFLAKKKISLKWDFDIDTNPPDIIFSRYDGDISSSKFWLDDLAGFSEPRAKLQVTLNTRGLPPQRADEKGKFKLAVYSLATNNNLKVTAIDEAGNWSTKEVRVKVDLTSPLILDVSPAEGETCFGETTTMTALIDDGNSEVKAVRFFLDGNLIESKYDPVLKQIVSPLKLTKDGFHKASLEIADAAGNASRREWSFVADTARIVVNRAQRKLYFYREGELVKIFPVAVGTPGYPTPKGRWKVINKRRNPSWSNPGSGWAKDMPPVIPPGPRNPLGPRAIDLSASGIRIHGTPNIRSIGTAASHGCIRMYPRDVIELFELVPVGAPVDII